MDRLPLFIMEEYIENEWISIHFWLLPFRQIIDRFASEELAQDCYRVRRVRTLLEAGILEDINNTRLQLPLAHLECVEWAE